MYTHLSPNTASISAPIPFNVSFARLYRQGFEYKFIVDNQWVNDPLNPNLVGNGMGGQNTVYWPGFAISVAGVVFLSATGIWYFRKTERTFADII